MRLSTTSPCRPEFGPTYLNGPGSRPSKASSQLLVRLEGRCAGRERIAVVAQLVEQVALDRLARRSDVDLENPRGVLAEDLVLHLGCQLRVTVLRGDLFGYREGHK